jgi:hypothetical protein
MFIASPVDPLYDPESGGDKQTDSERGTLWEKTNARLWVGVFQNPFGLVPPFPSWMASRAGYRVHFCVDEPAGRLVGIGADDLPVLIEALQEALAFIKEHGTHP